MTADAAFGYAPGKIILLGEHAVVYGQPALAATLDRGIRVVVSPGDGKGPVLRGTGFGIDIDRVRPDPEGQGPAPLRLALERLVELYGERVRGLAVSVDGKIPAGAGLGSSAALSVALVRGVRRYYDEPTSDDEVIRDAFELERVFHGTPSGVDHSTITRGGLVFFRRDADDTALENVELSRVELPRRLRLAIGVVGAHAGTSHAVGALRERARRHERVYQRIYESIGELVVEARDHVTAGNLGALGELMDVNQGYLNALGVSTPELETLCSIARDRGALGAKLTGAGGGGAMLALVDDDPQPIVRAFEAAGYNAFSAELRPDATVETSGLTNEATGVAGG